MSRPVRELQAALATLVGAEGARPAVGAETVALAARNGVAALLHAAGEHSGWLGELPPGRLRALEGARRLEVAKQLKAEGHAEQLLVALHRAGVQVLVLKGLAFQHALYAPLGRVRAPGDVDLLVPRDQFPLVREIYDELGYEPYLKHPPGFYDDHHHMRPHSPPGDRSLLVDVHWTPIRVPNPYRIPLAAGWARSVPLEANRDLGEARRLDDLDLATHVALQMDFDDAYGGKGRSLFDLAAWIFHRGLDPQDLRERAAEWGGSEAFSRVEAMLERCFDLDLGARPVTPAVPERWWALAAQQALWLPARAEGLPVWYRQHLARAFTHASGVPRALALALAPVWSNWRLGGGGYAHRGDRNGG